MSSDDTKLVPAFGVTEAAPTTAQQTAPKAAPKPKPGTRQVRLRLTRVDIWSALKLSFLAAVTVAIVTLVANFLIFVVLDSFGVFRQLTDLLGNFDKSAGNVAASLSLANVMGFTLIVALLDTVVITVIGAISALLYNLSVKITGGLLVGFTND